uniref:Uncharacterized protein n=1 Tax=uncultured euryarchaeote Alv-FOS5 TaxID=337891 RepID=Q3SBA5_9EURY|nr:hypothetical protein [uncultured euryarchaeote Alv-FOS5]
MAKKLGLAFLRGLGMFGGNNVSESQMRKVLKSIEERHRGAVKFLGIYGVHNDIIVFEKQGVHYATVGTWIEYEMKKLGLDIPVTTRSMRTVSEVVKKWVKG